MHIFAYIWKDAQRLTWALIFTIPLRCKASSSQCCTKVKEGGQNLKPMCLYNNDNNEHKTKSSNVHTITCPYTEGTEIRWWTSLVQTFMKSRYDSSSQPSLSLLSKGERRGTPWTGWQSIQSKNRHNIYFSMIMHAVTVGWLVMGERKERRAERERTKTDYGRNRV